MIGLDARGPAPLQCSQGHPHRTTADALAALLHGGRLPSDDPQTLSICSSGTLLEPQSHPLQAQEGGLAQDGAVPVTCCSRWV